MASCPNSPCVMIQRHRARDGKINRPGPKRKHSREGKNKAWNKCSEPEVSSWKSVPLLIESIYSERNLIEFPNLTAMLKKNV